MKHAVKILGMGCAKCADLTKATEAALGALGLPYELEKVTDFLRFADFGVMMTPALVLDGQVLVAGKVPAHKDLVQLIAAKTATKA